MIKNIIITGGCGFIGVHLINFLLKTNNIKIIVIDNYSTGKNIIISPNVNYFFCCASKINQLNINTKIHEIYHLASIASPKLYNKKMEETLLCGYEITKEVLKFAVKHSSKVLFASSSEIYGEPTVNIQHEEYFGNVNSFGPRSCYDESKRVGETLMYIYKQKYNLDIKIARIFNTYGENMNINDGRIITEIIKCALYDNTLYIHGNGNQTRSFCYIKNTVNLLVKLMDSDCQEPVNIGNDIEITINCLIDIFQNISGKKIKKQYISLIQNDPLQRKPDLTKCKKICGEIEYTSLEKGLMKMYCYYLLQKKLLSLL